MMSDDDKDDQPEADALPDKAKLAQEWQSDIQLTESENGLPSAPSYEEAMTCSYPILPSLAVESSVMHRAQQPMHQLQPYSTTGRQPHSVQTIVQHQNPPVGPKPASITCPSCKQKIETKVDFVSNTKTHLVALLLCLFGCWCCVCCPYCMDDCQNGNHTCQNCGAYVGTYKN